MCVCVCERERERVCVSLLYTLQTQINTTIPQRYIISVHKQLVNAVSQICYKFAETSKLNLEADGNTLQEVARQQTVRRRAVETKQTGCREQANRK